MGETDAGEAGCATVTAARGGTPERDTAWEAYWDWTRFQTWGPASGLTGEEQYRVVEAKAPALGLEIAAVVGRQ